ncbi:MAG: hypothetical protein KY455_10015 [Euryarchaeota archaeon]|nr:hypothetical protein [Euryarchaeota archaeon]
MAVPRDKPAFNKWDPDGTERRARTAARHIVQGLDPETADRKAGNIQRDPLAGKKWLLRWAWAISTGFLLFGYVVIVLVLTDHGDLIGM